MDHFKTRNISPEELPTLLDEVELARSDLAQRDSFEKVVNNKSLYASLISVLDDPEREHQYSAENLAAAHRYRIYGFSAMMNDLYQLFKKQLSTEFDAGELVERMEQLYQEYTQQFSFNDEFYRVMKYFIEDISHANSEVSKTLELGGPELFQEIVGSSPVGDIALSRSIGAVEVMMSDSNDFANFYPGSGSAKNEEQKIEAFEFFYNERQHAIIALRADTPKQLLPKYRAHESSHVEFSFLDRAVRKSNIFDKRFPQKKDYQSDREFAENIITGTVTDQLLFIDNVVKDEIFAFIREGVSAIDSYEFIRDKYADLTKKAYLEHVIQIELQKADASSVSEQEKDYYIKYGYSIYHHYLQSAVTALYNAQKHFSLQELYVIGSAFPFYLWESEFAAVIELQKLQDYQ